MSYLYHLLIYFGIYASLAMSLNIVVGYCGLLTLAQAGHFAIGAYAYALGVTCWGMNSACALILAFVAGGISSLLISIPTWRLKGDYFVLVSMSVQVLIYAAAYNWMNSDASPGTLKNLTNGPFGIAGIPRPEFFGFKFNSSGSMALFSLAITVFFALVSKRLLCAPFGRVLQCLRDDELATRNLGKSVLVFKLEALLIASSMASVAGAVFASYTSYISPSMASMDQSILLLSMIIVGGMGNLAGPMTGAATLLLIPEVLRFMHLPDAVAAEMRIMLYGLLLVLLVHFKPSGIAGTREME